MASFFDVKVVIYLIFLAFWNIFKSETLCEWSDKLIKINKHKLKKRILSVGLSIAISFGNNGMNVVSASVVDGISDRSLESNIDSIDSMSKSAEKYQELSGAAQSYKITTSSTEGGSITSTCSVEGGSNKTIYVNVNEGYEISTFKVDGSNAEIKDLSYTFNDINADHTVYVSFKKKTYSVSMEAEGSGKITGPKTVEHGSAAVYSFIPAVGYEVTEVVIDGDYVTLSDDNTYTFINVCEPHEISATFEAIICTVNIGVPLNGEFTIKCGGIDVEDGEELKYGSIIQLGNIADECYTFSHYEINGEPVTTSSYKVIGPIDINAVFVEKTYNISSVTSSNGSVSFGGATTVQAGEQVTIDAAPDIGYEVVSMTVNGVDVTDQLVDNSFMTDDTWYGLNVVVIFQKQKFVIETSCNEGGSISPTVEVEYNNDVTVAFTPEEGYFIQEVYVDGEIIENPGLDYYFKDIRDSHTVEVTYALITCEVKLEVGENGYATEEEVVDYGGSYELECFPDGGYQVDKVMVNGYPVNLRKNKYTVSNIKKDCLITVSFKENEIVQTKIKGINSKSYNSLEVVWGEVEKAEGYEIYRMSETESDYKMLDRVAVCYGNQKYIDTGLTAGKEYSYTVRAYRISNGEYQYGLMSDSMEARPKPGKTSIKSITTEGTTALSIKWKKISGVSGYELYVSSNKDGKYSMLAQLSGSSNTSYQHLKCKKGKTYYYKVRAYRNVSGEKIYGGYCNIKSGTTSYIDTVPYVRTVKIGIDYVLIKWKRVSDVDGYDIMWCAAKHGKYEKMATMDKTKSTYKDKFYQTGCNYYKIRAFKYVNGKKKYSCLSTVCGAYVTIRKK